MSVGGRAKNPDERDGRAGLLPRKSRVGGRPKKKLALIHIVETELGLSDLTRKEASILIESQKALRKRSEKREREGEPEVQESKSPSALG